MNTTKHHRPGSPLMPEGYAAEYRTWLQQYNAHLKILVACYSGLVLASTAIFAAAAVIVLYRS